MTRNARKDITRCICDFNPGIGDFICCDKCSVWQHMGCMGVHPGKIPKVYECDQCNPRPLNKQAAVQLQLKLKDEESSDDSEEEVPTTKRANTAKRRPPAKRSRKPSSSSHKSLDEDNGDDSGNSYHDVKENMYSPAIKHRLEARTEAQPSYELSPGTMSRNHPQAGSPGPTVAQPTTMLQVVNHGPARVVITRQNIKAGQYIADYMGHFKRLAELYHEIGGKSTLYKRPLNYVLHYPTLDVCVDTREHGTISRFLRKSCHPNAKVRSYLQEGKLHLGIYSLELIPSNSEITLSFNLPIEEYQFVQTCACSNVSCLVSRNNERLTNKSTTPLPRTESTESMSDEEHRKHKLTREEMKIQSYIQSIEKREREEQRKRTLSETLKSPARPIEDLDTAETPNKGNKRRRKGSGRKIRKPSGNSSLGQQDILKSPEHFIFDPGVSPKSEPASPVKPCPSPVKNVKEPPLSRHHLCFNGYSQDIHLRPLNVSPHSRVRRDLQLHNQLTPVKIHKDGFIVPLHGSLLRYSKLSSRPDYKNNKKRWLEHYIQEKQNTPEPPKTPEHVPEELPAEPMAVEDGINEVFLPPVDDVSTNALSDATKTLQLEDPPAPEALHEYPDLHIEMPTSIDFSNTPTTPSSTPITPLPGEKKKKVSLADYRKRLQSRTPKSDSHSSESNVIMEEPRPSSDKENSVPAVAPEQPMFEPISPETSSSSLLEELAKPSLSETVSLEPSRKVRRLEEELYYQIKEATAPLRHDTAPNGSGDSPGAIDDATISKIKEILYNSNPSLKVNSRSPSPKLKAPRLVQTEDTEFSSNGGNPNLSDNLLRSCIDDSRLRYEFGENQKDLKLNDSVSSTTYNTLPGNSFNRWDSR